MADRNASAESREAVHGQKMIEIKVRFWTDDLAPKKGSVIPRNAWTAGIVRIKRNATHGIVPGKPRPFNSLMEIGSAIQDVLLDHGIVLHPSRTDRKFICDAEAAGWHKAAGKK